MSTSMLTIAINGRKSTLNYHTFPCYIQTKQTLIFLAWRLEVMVQSRVKLLSDGTCAVTSFRLSTKWTNPFISPGGDRAVVSWQLRCAHQLAARVVVLERLSSVFVWRLQTAHSTPFSTQIRLHHVSVIHHI